MSTAFNTIFRINCTSFSFRPTSRSSTSAFLSHPIVNSGERIKELRAARRMTRQQLAEQIGLSVDALREIEAGVNGAKIDTLISIAELFHISLRVYLHLCKNRKN